MAIRYHYCSSATYEKIISQKTLRLSDMRLSNDTMEMEWFLKQHEGVGRLSEAVGYLDDGHWEHMEHYLTAVTALTDCYAVCLARGGDKLSQWERYAKQCTGYSIGFHEEKLCSYIQRISDAIPEERKHIDVQTIPAFYDLLAQDVEYERIKNISYPYQVADAYVHVFDYLKSCAFKKHIGFHEEKEFRIALLFAKGMGEAIQNELAPYLGETEFGEDTEVRYASLKFEPEIIEEVCIGPLNEACVDEVRQRLKECGIRCRVKKSDIPYSPKRQKVLAHV